MKDVGVGAGFCLLFTILYVLYLLVVGAVIAFLWNWILVDTFKFDIPTLNLWTGLGLAILVSIVVGFFRRT